MQSYRQIKRLRSHVQQRVEEVQRNDEHFPSSEKQLSYPSDSSDPEQIESISTTHSGQPDQSPLERKSTHDDPPDQDFIYRLARATAGVHVEYRDDEKTPKTFLVKAHSAEDTADPHTWPRAKRVRATAIIWFIVFACGYASAADSFINERASKSFHVSKIAEGLATAMFLFGNAIGALAAGPISETAGRNPTYLISMALYMICILITALAPNLPVQLVFRFFAGLFASPPLTIYGGSLADMWDDDERSLVWPLFATSPMLGPILAPIPSGWLVNDMSISWHWVDWLILIISGTAWLLAFFGLHETLSPMMLTWKADALRKATHDDRFKSSHELGEPLVQKLKTNMSRPIIFFTREPIVIALGLYLTVIYVLVFTFLHGFTPIFTDTYGFSPGQTGSAFGAIAIGVLIDAATQPIHANRYHKYLAAIRKTNQDPEAKVEPEFRLWSAIFAAPFLPISLFWIGWTNNASISYWSGIVAAGMFGWSLMGIFIAVYQYIIDSYETHSSSALSSITFMRYMVAGCMVIADMPMYQTLGVHWTLTMLGCLGLVLMPLPLLFWKFGDKVRSKSNFAKAF